VRSFSPKKRGKLYTWGPATEDAHVDWRGRPGKNGTKHGPGGGRSFKGKGSLRETMFRKWSNHKRGGNVGEKRCLWGGIKKNARKKGETSWGTFYGGKVRQSLKIGRSLSSGDKEKSKREHAKLT